MNEEAKVKLSAPWTVYTNQIKALFSQDKNVNVVYDETNSTIKIYVNGATKAEAIQALIPATKQFGNVEVKVDVIPANPENMSRVDLIKAAFEGNPALDDIVTGELFGQPIAYAVMKKEVVQYFNDDLSDANGICSTLFQDLAKEVFGEDGSVYFCTATNGDPIIS